MGFASVHDAPMKHWIFDFDGTLVDSEGFFSETFRYALSPFGIDVHGDLLERIRHKHPHRIFEDFLSDEQSRVAFARLDEATSGLIDQIPLFPGVRPLLETLHDAGVSLSIWTGRDGDSTHSILQRHGLTDAFHSVVTGTCVPNNKPSLDGLIQIQQTQSAQGDEMVMVGDHHHDMEPALQLGCLAIHARWKSRPVDLPGHLKPHARFSTVGDFHNWIKAQLKRKA